MEIKKLSSSAVLSYLSNPYFFFKDYVLRERDMKDSVATLTGKIMHTLIENMLNKKNVSLEKVQIEACKNATNLTLEDIDSVFKQTGVLDRYLKQEDTMFKTLLEEALSAPKIETEKSFLAPVITPGGVETSINGVIDLVTHLNDYEVIITDWKSVSKFSNETNVKYIIQGLFYTLAMIAEGKDVKEMRFVEIKKSKNMDGSDRCRVVKIDLSQLPIMAEMLLSIIEIIVKDVETRKTWLPNPSDIFDKDPLTTLNEALRIFSAKKDDNQV